MQVLDFFLMYVREKTILDYISLSPAPSDRGSTIIFIQYNHPVFFTEAAKGLLCEKCQAEILTKCNANAVLFLTSLGF